MKRLEHRPFRLLAPLCLWLTLAACANELPAVRHAAKTPTQNLDLGAMSFKDLASGAELSLSRYMREHGRRYVLLMWGSEGCNVCKDKALDLSRNYLAKHELFLTSEERGFELIGINTDTGNLYNRFLKVWGDSELRASRGYSYTKWWDPAGATAMKYVLPAGKSFGVPITALFDTRGLVFLYQGSDHYELPDLIARVAAAVKNEAPPSAPPPAGSPPNPEPSPSPQGTPEPTPFPSPRLKEASLGRTQPGRLAAVTVTDCEGQRRNLDQVLGKARLKIVQIDRGACDTTCEANATILDQVKTREPQLSIATLTLATMAPRECRDGRHAIGGEEFFAREMGFDNLVRWTYAPVFNRLGIPASLPPLKGPLTLAFDDDNGQLLLAEEGQLDLDSLSAALAGRREPAPSAAFKLIAREGATDFHKVRAASQFTVLVMMESGCRGCVEILNKWQEPSGLGPFCAASGTLCQIRLIKTALGEPDPTLARKEELEALAAEGVKDFDMMVGSETIDDGRGNAFYRFTESFLIPLNNRNGDPDAWFYVFDRDGRIVFDVRDEAANALKVETFLRSQKQGDLP